MNKLFNQLYFEGGFILKILITGAAGFIGYNLSSELLARGYDIIGIDNMNNYYEVSLKNARLSNLKTADAFKFFHFDIEDRDKVKSLFANNQVDVVINLAAQAGVRYSLENPHSYINSNIVGFMNILEACRYNEVQHLIYASSSSVYGANTSLPFSVHDNVDHPLSLYAATKKANELMAHTYSSLYGLPTTGLRFFTVYGPWGRPDMALFKFTKNIIEGKQIDVFNNGEMMRDFTYVDDIVEAISRLIEKKAIPNPKWSGKRPDPATSYAPYKIYNIGNNNPVNLLDFIEAIEEKVGRKAIKNYMPLQAGDVPATYADVEDLYKDIDFRPQTSIKDGVGKFVDWYIDYYKIDQ